MKYLLYILLLIAAKEIIAQEPNYYRSTLLKDFSLAEDLFSHNLYGPNAITLETFLKQNNKPLFSASDRITNTAEVDKAISLLRLNSPGAAEYVKSLINSQYNKAEFIPLILEYGSYCYNNSQYNEAIEIYSLIDNPIQLSEVEMCEMAFKKGYSYFINKDFKQAIRTFEVAKELRNTYFYVNNYYYGMCQYFENNFNSAVESFKRASGTEVYSSQVPYYLAQIYFAQKDFDKLLPYAEQKINDKSIQNIKEIRLLLGQAYYIRGDYPRALTHLEYYEANTDKLTAEEFYQLAFTQYKLNRCDLAKKNFLELTNLNSKMGQLSNYYLGDCLIKEGEKLSAKAAIKKVSQMDFDLNMKEEANFNYGKLAAETGNHREAINLFIDIPENNRYYKEAQEIINDILVNSGDYENSIKIIESLPKLTEKIKATYQSLSLKQALLLYAEGNEANATTYFNKSLKYPLDKNYVSQASFWLAQMKNLENKYEESIKMIDKYFELSNGVNDLPAESSNFMAHYIQGYNYLKLKEYKKAELQFKNAIVGININREELKNDYILNRVLPDAFVRAGDCLFKVKDYKGAKTFYEQAIQRKQGGYVYALYQRGLIEGLTGEVNDKIETMKTIVSSYSNSDYGDDAHMQLGDAYLVSGDVANATNTFINLINKYQSKSDYYHSAHLKLGLINYNKGDISNALYYYKRVANGNASSTEKNEAIKAIEEIYVDKLINTQGYLSYLDSIGYQASGLGRDSLTYHLAYNVFNNAEYTKAAESFTNYLNQYPQGYYKNDARYYRAESNNVLKSYGKSLSDYEAIIKDGPSKYYNKAVYKAALISFNFTQEFDKALKYYKEYETLTGDVGEIFQSQYGALRAAFRLSKGEDVITYGQKVLDNLASTKEEKAAAHYYMAKIYFKNGNADKAQAAFSQVEKLGTNNQAAEARYMLAEILYNQKQYDKAEKQCEYANEKNTNYPFWVAKGLLLLSDIYVVKNDLLNARAAIEAVLENFKDDNSIITQANAKLEALKLKEANNNRIKTSSGQLELMKKKN